MAQQPKPNWKRDAFRQAIRESLERLVQSGEQITKTRVIEGARFTDGRRVGKTTLYSKNARTGEFVHAGLLREITEASDRRIKRDPNKVTRTETLSGLRNTIRELKCERDELIDQIAEQEARLKVAEGETGGSRNILQTQEIELYVLASVANELSHGAVEDFKEIIRRFEKKYRNQPKLELANKDVDRYINDVKSYKLTGLADVQRKIKHVTS